MRDKFRQGSFKVQVDLGGPGARVVKAEPGQAPKVESFELPKLQQAGKGDYDTVKSKFGSFATTDRDRVDRNQKDRRFNLSHLVRSHLSVDEEERRAIAAKVEAEVSRISEEAKKRASEEGYAEGLKKGHAEAHQNFLSEGQERLARLDGLLGEMEHAKEDVFRTNERFLIDLIYRVSKMILLKELSTDREYVLRLVKELIERVGVRENITIKIHPDEVESMEMLREGLEKSFGAMKNVNIEVSNQVKVGGCMLETEWNAIDASVETQLKGVQEALFGKQATGDAT